MVGGRLFCPSSSLFPLLGPVHSSEAIHAPIPALCQTASWEMNLTGAWPPGDHSRQGKLLNDVSHALGQARP